MIARSLQLLADTQSKFNNPRPMILSRYQAGIRLVVAAGPCLVAGCHPQRGFRPRDVDPPQTPDVVPERCWEAEGRRQG